MTTLLAPPEAEISYRPYQTEDFNAVATNYELGFSRQICIQATGLGKTRIMAGIPNLQSRLGLFGKVMVIVNRIELAEQTKDAFEQANPGLIIGIEQAEKRAPKNAHIVIISVQTMGTAKFDEEGNPIHKKRLLEINPEEYSAILVDETHRAPANTFRSILMYMGVYPGRPNYRPWVMLLGFTATPNRADNKGLEEFYECVSCNRDIIWGIQNNWLTDIHAYRVSTSVNLDDYDIGSGNSEFGRDFSKKELQNAVNVPARNKLVIERILELHEGTRGIVFCVDVQHGEDLCAMANSLGLSAKCIFGHTPKNERKQILKDHRSGKFIALIGCGVFIEGYDDPGIGFVAMCRPTQSKLLYTQAIGRGLRPFPSPEAMMEYLLTGETPEWVKPYCILIDFCDLSSKHNIVTIGSIFGLGSSFDFKGKSVDKQASKMKEEVSKLDKKIQAELEKEIDNIQSIEHMKSIVERIDLFKTAETPSEIKNISTLEWLKINGKYEISLPGKDVIRIKETPMGEFVVDRSVNGNFQTVNTTANLKSAVKWAEDNCITDEHFDLLNAEATWKSKRPSHEQISYLASLRKDMFSKFSGNMDLFEVYIKKNYSKGEVSTMISEALANKRQ